MRACNLMFQPIGTIFVSFRIIREQRFLYKASVIERKVVFPILVTERWARSWSRCTIVYRQSARRWREVYHAIDPAVGCHYFPPCLRGYLRSFHQMAPPVHGTDCSTHPTPTYHSLIDPERMKGWVGLVVWPVADSLPAIVVIHQLQVERRTGQVCQL